MAARSVQHPGSNPTVRLRSIVGTRSDWLLRSMPTGFSVCLPSQDKGDPCCTSTRMPAPPRPSAPRSPAPASLAAL